MRKLHTTITKLFTIFSTNLLDFLIQHLRFQYRKFQTRIYQIKFENKGQN